MSLLVEILSGILLAVGSGFCVVGGLGLVRMPDFYARIHAGGVTDTMGAGLVLLGLTLRADEMDVAVKLIFILVLLMLTSPTSVHALANGAYTQGYRPEGFDMEEPS